MLTRLGRALVHWTGRVIRFWIGKNGIPATAREAALQELQISKLAKLMPHVSAEHLKRYLAEFDFRYNNREALGVGDRERMVKSIAGIVGKRLTYRRTDREGAPVRA